MSASSTFFRKSLAFALLLAMPQLALAQHAGHGTSHAERTQPDEPDAHAGHRGGVDAGHGHGKPGAATDAHAHHAQAGHDAHRDRDGKPHAHGVAMDAHGARAGGEGHDGHVDREASHHDHAADDPHAAHGPAPQEPRTPIPALTEADFAAAFPALDHHAMEHASPITTMVLIDRLEAWDADHGTGQAWEATAWIGGDIHRVWLRSEGEREAGRTGASDLEVLYGRSITPWWDVVAGLRQDFRPGSRTWAAFGVQGLAPHLFEVSATVYVGDGGQAQAKVEAEYDVRFTNRLILQPLVEATVSLKDEPAERIGSGLNKVETGLRLRYEISRRFAPYLGLVHERAFGASADHVEAAGGHARDTRVVAGVRVWF